MNSLQLVTVVAAGLALGGARVISPFSVVLQLTDLQSPSGSAMQDTALFKCEYGCKVFVDLSTDDIGIDQDYVPLVNFTDIVGDNGVTLDGYELPAGYNYELRSRIFPHLLPYDFVFYVVSSKAPNYGSAVMRPVITDEMVEDVISADDKNRFFTVISSFPALLYHDFSGTFPAGYPKIYTAGFDAVSDVYGVSNCTAVYNARSQYHAEQSSLSIPAPIVTVDFGYEGDHSVSVNVTGGAHAPRAAVASTVYMSPGYVGCPYEGNQTYHSTADPMFADYIMLISDSLDITADYNAVPASETVHLSVNRDVLDFNSLNSSSFSKHYDRGAFNVAISWNRKSTNSSWAVQLDFGVDPVAETTTELPETTETTEEHVPTTSPTIPTTTSGKGGLTLSVLVMSIIVFVLA